ncbi:MAG: alanine:cation symporter family protein [Adlercreutzia equolifaciens]
MAGRLFLDRGSIAGLGMATNYAEAVMAQKTRVVDEDGTVHGGPVYYITGLQGDGEGRSSSPGLLRRGHPSFWRSASSGCSGCTGNSTSPRP